MNLFYRATSIPVQDILDVDVYLPDFQYCGNDLQHTRVTLKPNQSVRLLLPEHEMVDRFTVSFPAPVALVEYSTHPYKFDEEWSTWWYRITNSESTRNTCRTRSHINGFDMPWKTEYGMVIEMQNTANIPLGVMVIPHIATRKYE